MSSPESEITVEEQSFQKREEEGLAPNEISETKPSPENGGEGKEQQSKEKQTSILVDELIEEFEEVTNKSLREEERRIFRQRLESFLASKQNPKALLRNVIKVIKEEESGSSIIQDDVLGIFEEESKKQEEESKKQEEESKKQEEESKTEKISNKLETKKNTYSTLEDLVKSVDGISGNATVDELRAKLIAYKSADPDKVDIKALNRELKSILEKLKNPDSFRELVTQVKGKGEKAYSAFKTSILSIDPSFQKSFEQFDLGVTGAREKTLLGTDSLTDVVRKDNMYEKKTDDGFLIRAGDESRKLSLSEDKYSLSSELDNKKRLEKIDEIEKKTEEEISPIYEALGVLSGIIKYLEISEKEGVDIKEVKKDIKEAYPEYYEELKLDSMSSYTEILASVKGEQAKKESEKKELLESKKIRLDEIIEENLKEAEAKDALKKEILLFFHMIGFDMIPQDVTDLIFRELSAKTLFIPLASGVTITGFDVESFTFQGMGVPIEGGASEKNKKLFANLMNKMMTGNENFPIDISSVGFGGIIYRDENEQELSQTQIPTYMSSKLGFITGGTLNIIKTNLGMTKAENPKN